LIISLVIVIALIHNNANIPYHQTALAIPNLQANNTDISKSASNATSTNVVPTANHPPVVKVGPDQTVNENATVMLVGVAIDPDPDDKVGYSWTQVAGPAITLNGADTDTPSFTAPSNLPSDTPLKFTLTAKNDKGAESTSPATVTVTVKHINHPPVADADQDQTVNAGYVVSLDGTKSKDPDNDPIGYSWVQTDGPKVTLNGVDRNIASFTAPSNISVDTNLMFRLTVTDSKNATSTDNVEVTVKYIPPPNQPPKADAGTDQTVNSGDTVTLDGNASTDPDGSITSYSWVQTGGSPVTLNAAETSTPSFTAPSVSEDTTMIFALTVTDDKAARNTSTVKVTVKFIPPPNQPPVANAGTDQTVNSGDYVTLYGTASSDPDNGAITSYLWTQTEGPTIDLANNTNPTANFLAPSLSSDTQLKFSLTVKDDKGDSSSPASVSITVKAAALAPTPPITPSSNMGTTEGTSPPSEEQYSFVRSWGSKGTDEGQFDGPSGIAIDSSNNVYVTDLFNNRIQKFTADGTFITSWGSKGHGVGQFNNPSAIAIDSSGNMDIADWDDNIIQKFTADGTFIAYWGIYGSQNGQFQYPSDIAIDSSGNVYVVDSNNNRIQVFALSS
jgi:hypothetical protein